MRGTDRSVVLGLYRSIPDRRLLEQALSIGLRGLDTAYNYAGFASHRILARTASDLLPELTISSKVGFFPHSAGSRHSLDPIQLRAAVRQSVDDLGTVLNVIFLHNPEESLSALTPEEGGDRFAEACSILAEATTAGLAESWGIASWNPASLLKMLDHSRAAAIPPPDVLMVPAGLTVVEDSLRASEALSAQLPIAPYGLWGMSPFGGSTTDSVWHTTNIGVFLQNNQSYSNVQAAFRVAYELPHVHQIAVGTSNIKHLQQLIAATELPVDAAAVHRYRNLIRAEISSP